MESVVINCETKEESRKPLSTQRIAFLDKENEAIKEFESELKEKRDLAISKLQSLGLTIDDLKAIGLG